MDYYYSRLNLRDKSPTKNPYEPIAQTTSTAWQKYPDHLSVDYTLHGYPARESYRLHLRGVSPRTLEFPHGSMGAREMVGVFTPCSI